MWLLKGRHALVAVPEREQPEGLPRGLVLVLPDGCGQSVNQIGGEGKTVRMPRKRAACRLAGGAGRPTNEAKL